MLNLCLAVLSSALVSIAMRLSKSRVILISDKTIWFHQIDTA